eukprot:TRINITY_DN27314_c0_g1_i1.p1 TRINITY_DN27314_c0_g1~~TRINITY_DN27314_c0_g1_i1.p1  ORF type:complete len:282 (-),score=87.69 TRINITY_DN27314_c0_g1_i1:81-926(-)
MRQLGEQLRDGAGVAGFDASSSAQDDGRTPSDFRRRRRRRTGCGFVAAGIVAQAAASAALCFFSAGLPDETWMRVLPRSGGRPSGLRALSPDFEGRERVDLASLKRGDKVRGVVLRNLGAKRYEVDIGATKVADLQVGELRDGFPTTEALLKTGDVIDARILKVNKDPASGFKQKIWLTRRSGDLMRPFWEHDKLKSADVSAFAAAAPSDWTEGTIVEFSVFAIWLRLTPPDGGAPCEGMMHKSEFLDSIVDDAKYGQKVKVRVVRVDEQKNQLFVSMKPL